MKKIIPSLKMVLPDEDLKKLFEFLCAEKDIALIKSVGKGRWQAFSDFEITNAGRHCLFHSAAGPLPLLSKIKEETDGLISNPFDGWKENRAGADPEQPYFGSGHPAIFWLNVRFEKDGVAQMSYFEWIGNHYSILGRSAPDVTKKWWERLRRWVKKQSLTKHES